MYSAGGKGAGRVRISARTLSVLLTLKVVFHSPSRKIPEQQSLTQISLQPVAWITGPPPPQDLRGKLLQYLITGIQNTAFCHKNGVQSEKGPTEYFSILRVYGSPAPRGLQRPYLRHWLYSFFSYPLQFINHKSSYHTTLYTPR